MSAAENHRDLTALRALELRTRELSLDGQMVECVDLLESPEFVIEDLIRSVEQIEKSEGYAGGSIVRCNQDSGNNRFFYPSLDLFVQGDRCSFTCLASAIDISDGEGAGRIDFAAVTCESKPFPILGFTQTSEMESAYPILLRSLSSLIELARPGCFSGLDRDIYRGIVGETPAFDLTLVLWDEEDIDSRRPLCELTRDLAEVLKSMLASESRFPPILNDIVCLRMNPKRFDGRLRFVWRV